ncbi:MAG: hypothetical protein CSYNP_02376 [Syntrophus sp. SKADARSKE-3]|nr:hypothetical protein [Syntrophus sp. SKADARSKE-3]
MANAFTFKFTGHESDLEVSSVYGEEALSTPYQFTLELRSTTGNIRDAVLKRAALGIIVDNDRVTYYGIITQFGQVRADHGYVYYQAVMAPKMSLLQLNRRSDVFTDIPFYKKSDNSNIMETVLASRNSLAADVDYEIDLLEGNLSQYAPSTDAQNRWSHACQYEETDLDFLSRLMEREGVYYYFKQGTSDRSGKEQELAVFTDTKVSHASPTRTLTYRPTAELRTGPMAGTYQELVMEQFMLPKTVTLTNYVYEQSAKGVLSVNKTVSDQGIGDVHIHGENFSSADAGKDGDFLAGVRAQELLCRGTRYAGKSVSVPMMPGMLIKLDNADPALAGTYLVTKVTHRGTQPLPGPDGSVPVDSKFVYGNSFTCISSSVQFRPERVTVKPRIAGTMNAFIDGNVDIPLDSKGRYKVTLPFACVRDSATGKVTMKKSAWIRLAFPYGGANSKTYGMHFPLHKGAEVILAFRDGDPDLPVITGAAYNSQNFNPVTSDNRMQHIIKTAGGNQIIMDDTVGAESISLFSPYGEKGNWIHLGAGGEDDKESVFHVKSSGNKHEMVLGQEDSFVIGSENYVTIGSKMEAMLGTASEFTLAMKTAIELAGTIECKFGHHVEFGKTTDIIKDKSDLLGTDEVVLSAGLPAAEKLVLSGVSKALAVGGAAIGALLAAAGGDIGGAFFPDEESGVSAMKQMGASMVPIIAGTVAQVVALGVLVKKLNTEMTHAISKIEMTDSGIKIHAKATNSLGAPNEGVQLGIGPQIALPTSFIKITPTLNNERILLTNSNTATISLVDGTDIVIAVTNGGSLSLNGDGVEISQANNGGKVTLDANTATMEKPGGGGKVVASANDIKIQSGNDSITINGQTGIALNFGGGQLGAGPLKINQAGIIQLG